MYAKYNCCTPIRPHPLQISKCCPKSVSKIDNTQPGAIPESVRIANNWNCSTATVTVTNIVQYESTCVTSIHGISKLSIPVTNSPPIVSVKNVPASVTINQRVREIQTNESNPYNPETRFAAYFPPAPLPYICPERIPNNESKPSTADCLPIRRFQGSAQAAGLV
jgi:hypothetical protein